MERSIAPRAVDLRVFFAKPGAPAPAAAAAAAPAVDIRRFFAKPHAAAAEHHQSSIPDYFPPGARAAACRPRNDT